MTTSVVSLCDVNVIVALVHDAHEHSGIANDWLESISRRRQVRLCRVSQLGFLRVITSPRVFGRYALRAVEAWSAFDTLISDDRFSYTEEPKDTELVFRELAEALQPGAVVGTDVYLAAFARAGEFEIVTFDGGFRRFSGLRARVLETP